MVSLHIQKFTFYSHSCTNTSNASKCSFGAAASFTACGKRKRIGAKIGKYRWWYWWQHVILACTPQDKMSNCQILKWIRSRPNFLWSKYNQAPSLGFWANPFYRTINCPLIVAETRHKAPHKTQIKVWGCKSCDPKSSLSKALPRHSSENALHGHSRSKTFMNKAEDAVQWGRENLIPKNVSNWPKRPITDIDYLVWKALGLYTTRSKSVYYYQMHFSTSFFFWNPTFWLGPSSRV